jgi:hypothetical protein
MHKRDVRVRRAFRPCLDRFETRLTPSGYDWFVPVPPSDLDAPEPPTPPSEENPTLPEIPWETIVIYPIGSDLPVSITPGLTPNENAATL